jgi:peptide/nickel transport system substrate-binding protein
MHQENMGRTMITRRSFISLASLAAGSAILAACGGTTSGVTPTAGGGASSTGAAASPSTSNSAATPSAVVRGGDLVVGYAQSQPTLDPPVPNSDSQSRLLNSVLDPLVWQNTADKFEPGLATSWEVSPDAKTYTFKLRQDVTFHDGTPFNAAAVKATFDRVADPKLKALLVGLLGPYSGTDVVDTYTARVNFTDAFPVFLNNLSATGIRPVSPTAAQKFGADFGTNIVGTGPFKMRSFAPDKIVFERFDAYNWAPASLNHQGPALLDTLTYRIIPEDATRVTAYENGEAQFIDFTPPQEIKRLQGNKNNHVDVIYLPGLPQMLQLNVMKSPTDDKQVRKAIQYAVDHQAIVQNVWFGFAKPAYGILSSPTPGYWADSDKQYPFSKDKAASTLDQAGWKMGSSGIREKGGQPLSILYITTDTAQNNQSGELVQAMLKDVGIDMKISSVSNQASLAQYQQGNYNVGRLGEINLDPSIMDSPVLSRNVTGGTQGNRSKYANPQVDQILDNARKEPDRTKRLAMYVMAQQIVMDDAIIIGQWEQSLLNTSTTRLSGVVYDPLGRPLFHATQLQKQ